jgi:hypothetical protein
MLVRPRRGSQTSFGVLTSTSVQLPADSCVTTLRPEMRTPL